MHGVRRQRSGGAEATRTPSPTVRPREPGTGVDGEKPTRTLLKYHVIICVVVGRCVENSSILSGSCAKVAYILEHQNGWELWGVGRVLRV